jgi:RHS repeat-associated protein
MKGLGMMTNRGGLFGAMGMLALTVGALVIADRLPVATVSALPSPFALPAAAEVGQVLLPDGRTFEVHGDHGYAYLVGGGQRVQLDLPRVRRFASITVMPSGQVLLWGGIDEKGLVLETGEWFEPTTKVFVTTGRLGLPARAGHTLTVLTDGHLLMTGGWTSPNKPTSEAVVWEAGNHQATLLSTVQDTPRFEATAEVVADGSVKIAGGFDDQGHALVSAWRFDPSTQSQTPLVATNSIAAASASLPVVNVQAAPLIGPLALRFSEPVDVAALNKQTVSLLGPGGVVHTRVVGAEGGRLAFIQLPDELLPASRYTVFVQGLRTTKGEPVPYTAIGFTTRQATDGVVVAGEGKRPRPDRAASGPGQPPLFVMAGGDSKPCARQDAFHLCRDRSYIKDGAWFPGQNNVADATGGHWRLYGPRQTLPGTQVREAALGKDMTALIGQVRQIDEKPVADVEISIGDQHVRTDAQGMFVLTGVPAGRQELFVDGRTASHGEIEFGRFLVGADVKANAVSRMPFVMYLPRVLARDKIALPSPTTRETVLTHPDMPGLELHIPSGTVFKDREGHVLSNIAIVPTPVDHAPFPLPDNFPTYFTIQPGDAVVQGLTPDAANGIRVVYPNYGKAKSTAQSDFWVYSVKQGWQMYGAGHVTPDATQIAPDTGVSLVWALGAGGSVNSTNPPNGRACDAPEVAQPVDVRTGLFFHEWDDLAIRDVLPLKLTRAYRSDDTTSHEFGIGASSNFGIHLYSTDGFTTPQLVMPCGEGIVFHLVSGAANWPLTGTVWQHADTNSSFYGATLQFLFDTTTDGAHWILNTKDGTQYAFTRHAPNSLSWIKDRYGNQLQMTYNGGLLEQVVSPSGRSLTLAHDTSNRVQSVIDNAGRSVSYAYDAAGTLNKVTFPDQTNEQYRYDANHRLLTMQDRRGNVWVSNKYDDTGRIITQTLADQTSWQFAYGTDGSGAAMTTITDPNGHQRRMIFDPVSNYEVADTRAFGTQLAQTTTYTRQASGLINTVTDALGRMTSNTYDSLGNIASVTRLSGTSEAVTYRFTYTSDFSQLASITDPLGHKTTFAYQNGCLVQVTDPLGHGTSITCNNAGQPTSVRDALGHLTSLSYRGYDLLAVTDALGRKSWAIVDTLGRTVSTKDPKGNVSLRQYDSNDRVIEVVDGLNQSTKLVYDGNGNSSKVTLPNGSVVSLEYDARNRLTQRSDALHQIESWTYNGTGGVLSHTDRKGQLTLYTYDALERRTMESFADGSGVQATYDAGNRITNLLDTTSGSLDWAYDGLNRVVRAASSQGEISYTYDTAGRRTAMTPASQPVVAYDYDDASRLTSLSQGSEVVQFGYDEVNRRSHLVLPNGIAMNYSYDAAMQFTAISYKQANGTSLGNLSYGYDEAGQAISQGGTFAPQELPDATTQDSEFDANNRLVSANGSRLSYDANGNLISDGANTYTWDARDRLVQITQGGSVQMSYAYDAVGRRISKVVQGMAPTKFLYDGANAVQEMQGGSVNPILTGLGVDERFARNDVTGRTYFLTDQINSTLALTDAAGAIRQQYSYDPYGNAHASDISSGFTNSYQYTGREADAVGLYYYRARYYSPVMGAFISEDPLGFGGGQNSFYAYVGSNPISRLDPFGLAEVPRNDPQSSLLGPPVAVPGLTNPAIPPPQEAPGESPSSGGLGAIAGFCGSNPFAGLACVVAGCLIPNSTADSCSDEPNPPPGTCPQASSGREENCMALKRSILNTCEGLAGRKRMACYAAANATYRQCMESE